MITAERIKDEKTLRDEFAMAALQGLISHPNVKPKTGTVDATFVNASAEIAYMFADAMMKQREK